MSGNNTDLTGKVCPYPVVCIIKHVDDMQPGEKLTFLVDDPLAIKSVPEELEEYEGVSCSIKKIKKNWEITITKS